MMIKGIILEILETWPLQLRVQTDTDIIHINLGLDVPIFENDLSSTINQILPGHLVNIDTQKLETGGMKINSINIVGKKQLSGQDQKQTPTNQNQDSFDFDEPPPSSPPPENQGEA